MQILRTNLVQRSSLPLPSAALIIDLRGSNDRLIERLRTEIEDLASDMKTNEMHQWRHLTKFLSYWSFSPLDAEDLKNLRAQQNSSQGPQPAPSATPAPPVPSSLPSAGLYGPAQQSLPNSPANAFLLSQNQPGSGDVFTENLNEILIELDRIRGNRHAAVGDLNPRGIGGQTVKDPVVRIIFVTDANHPASLGTAAAYAVFLKDKIKQKERPGYLPWLNITVLCLDNSVDIEPPEKLIRELRWNDSWKHFDQLIVSEQYTESAVRIDGNVQTYLAGLLLYISLIVPPSSFRATTSLPAPVVEEDDTINGIKGRKNVTLPPATYLYGVAAMEHSARWGRRLLNYGLVNETIILLQTSKTPENEATRKHIRTLVGNWLKNWVAQIGDAIPEKVPGNIQALTAITRAKRLSKPDQQVFSSHSLGFKKMSEPTVSELNTYLGRVTQTYTHPGEEPATPNSAPTLQDSIDSIPQIEQELQLWEDKEIGLKMSSPLLNSKILAQRILSMKDFFLGARGAIPRAKSQLKELGSAIAHLQTEHSQQSPDLGKKRDELKQHGEEAIKRFEAEAQKWPVLVKNPFLKSLMIVISVLFLLPIIAGFIMYFLALVALAATYLSSISPLFGVALYIAFWLLVLLLLALSYRPAQQRLRDSQKNDEESDFSTEALACGVLLLFSTVGAIIILVQQPFVDHALLLTDLPATALTILLAFFIVVFTTALAMIALEWIFYIPHAGHLRDLREHILNDLRKQHNDDIESVRRWITDEVALYILQEVGLTQAKNGGPGPYVTRIDTLASQLTKMKAAATDQQKLAAERLALSLSETQEGASQTKGGEWLNLNIRQEMLDDRALTKGFLSLKHSLSQDQEDLVELAELLLRIMGQETPTQIEQDFRNRLFQRNQEDRRPQLLMSALVATLLLASIETLDDDYVTHLTERFPDLDEPSAALSFLIEKLNKEIEKKMRDSVINLEKKKNSSWNVNTNSNIDPGIAQATDAFACWEQMLWEDKNEMLDEALQQDGLLAKLKGNIDAPAVIRLLRGRLNLFGRPLPNTPLGKLFLLLSPSSESAEFRQILSLSEQEVIEFPDVERVLLFYIQHYEIEPFFLPDTPGSPLLPTGPSAPTALPPGPSPTNP